MKKALFDSDYEAYDEACKMTAAELQLRKV